MHLQKVLSLTEEYDMLPKGSLVLCAVSGGADSICLLHLLHTLSQTMGFSLACAHYNHMLRGENAELDAAFVTDFCNTLNIPVYTGRGDVKDAACKAGRGVEETARTLRYAFLEQTAAEIGADRIATAHTADDNAETILMRLIRGTGLQGLCGIPPRRGIIVRPLLMIERAEILSYLKEHCLSHREDESNLDLSFTRNRLRHEVMPLLRSFNPRLISTMSDASVSLRQDNDFLNATAARSAAAIQPAEENRVLSRDVLLRLPPAIASRVLYLALEQIGVRRQALSTSHIKAILELIHGNDPSGRVTLPRGAVVQRVYGEILFAKDSDFSDSFSPIPLKIDGETTAKGVPWRIFSTISEMPAEMIHSGNTFWLKYDMINKLLMVRPRLEGDRIKLVYRNGTKTLKKLLIDEKVPRHLRDLIPVLANDASVVAVCGFGPDVQFAASPGERALKIEIEGI